MKQSQVYNITIRPAAIPTDIPQQVDAMVAQMQRDLEQAAAYMKAISNSTTTLNTDRLRSAAEMILTLSFDFASEQYNKKNEEAPW